MSATHDASKAAALGKESPDTISAAAPGLVSDSASSTNFDDAYQVFKGSDDLDATPEEEKQVVRKIDRRIVPILFFTYMLQYLDKNSINFASAFGLKEGTQMSGTDYSWLNSIFYFGYLAGQIPAGLLLQKLPTGRFTSITTIIWGVILMTTPACHNFGGMVANRLLLGMTESVVNPAFVFIMSIWYTNAEQPLRLESYYCTNGIATMFGGLIGYGVGNITTGLPRWMYVFIIFGALSLVQGIISFIWLPDLPATAKFLTPRERAIAVNRVARNRGGVKNQHFKKDQAIQFLKDPKTWILFFMATAAQVPNAAITSFTSQIIAGFGFDQLGTQYMQIPGGAVQFLALILGGVVCSKWPGLRCATMTFANTVCIIGAALLVALPNDNKWGRLVALWLCYFQGLGFSMSLTMISSNVAGSTKKQLTSALLFAGYCVGNIIGPQTFIDAEKPYYRSAYIAMLVGYSAKLAAVLVLYVYMYRENKRRDALGVEDEKAAIELGMQDVTELDNPGFRYSL